MSRLRPNFTLKPEHYAYLIFMADCMELKGPSDYLAAIIERDSQVVRFPDGTRSRLSQAALSQWEKQTSSQEEQYIGR